MTEHTPYADLRVLFFPFCAVLVGIILDEANKRIKFVGVPDTILQFAFAFCASLIINKCLPLKVATYVDVNYTWTTLQPQTILTVLLPPLIFESSFKINSNMFFAKLGFISVLTFWVYAITLLASIAMCLPILCLVVGSSYTAVALFVAIIVATDPVAVVAMLEEYGAPHKLRILIEGESLLNDGLALTAYRILTDVLKLELGIVTELDWFTQCKGLFLCLFVTPIFGCFFAAVVAWIVSKIKDVKKQQPVIIVSVYAVFIISDILGGSSALGLVFFGVTLNYYKELMSPETTEVALHLWATLGYWANNVIFIFSGYTVGRQIFQEPTGHHSSTEQLYFDWGRDNILNILLGFLLFPVMLVARLFSVYTFYKLAGYSPWAKKLPTTSDLVILAYSGLRGALGLILALELAKMSELADSADTQMILHMTCSSTLTCLLFQGMTFSSVMNKEGATRRSKYVKETASTFATYMMNQAVSLVNGMRSNITKATFLRAANWSEVHSQILQELELTVREADKEVQEQGAIRKNMKDEKSGNKIDIRITMYGNLLAKTREDWAKGALSGSTAHVVISLLEHGIDEGSISVDDIEELLDHIEPSRPFRFLCWLLEIIYKFVKLFSTCVAPLADFGGDPMFSKEDEPAQYKAKRKFEKWWILHTILLTGYAVALGWAIFINEDPNMVTARKSILMLSGIFFLMALFENIFLFKKIQKTKQKRGGRWSQLSAKNIIHLFGTTISVIISGVCSHWLLMNEECRSNKDHCFVVAYIHFGSTVLYSFYRIIISLPWVAVALHEKCKYRKLSRKRIRLAVLDYLLYLAKDIHLSRKLFPKDAFKPARQELHHFKVLFEGLLRLEFKDNDEETDIQRVNKTRQAIRMAATELKTTILTHKSDGLVPETAIERWQEVIVDIRDRAEAIIGVPPLHIRDWLISVPWISSLGNRSSVIVEMLAQHIQATPATVFLSGAVIKTKGQSIMFLTKGICKVHQWINTSSSGRKAHDSYVMQGELIGSRNILLHGSKLNRLPKTFPKRRYEASTHCEVVQLNSDVIEQLLQTDSKVYNEVNYWLQKKLICEEWKRITRVDNVSDEEFATAFAINGRIINKKERITIPEQKIAIIGCFTICSRSITDNCKIFGPTTIAIKPADERAGGMIFIMDREMKNVNNGAVSVEERSNMSFSHDVTSHKVVQTTGGSKTS